MARKRLSTTVVRPRRAKGPWQRFNEWNLQFCCSLPSTQPCLACIFFLPWISLINFFICIAQIQASAITSHFNSWQSDPLNTLSTCRDLQSYVWRPFRQCVPPTGHIFLCCIMVFYHIRSNSFSLHQRLRPSNTIPYLLHFPPIYQLAIYPTEIGSKTSCSQLHIFLLRDPPASKSLFFVCSRL